jgi:hypothetical protein
LSYSDPDDVKEVPVGFPSALPRIASFRGLRTLNVLFTKFIPDPRGGPRRFLPNRPTGDTVDLRFLVLNTIFMSLMGTWTSDMWQTVISDFSAEPDALVLSPVTSGEEPIELESLAISNLSDFTDDRLAGSPAFKAVLAAPSFKSLKLLITRWQDWMYDCPAAYELWLPDVDAIYENLPTT